MKTCITLSNLDNDILTYLSQNLQMSKSQIIHIALKEYISNQYDVYIHEQTEKERKQTAKIINELREKWKKN